MEDEKEIEWTRVQMQFIDIEMSLGLTFQAMNSVYQLYTTLNLSETSDHTDSAIKMCTDLISTTIGVAQVGLFELKRVIIKKLGPDEKSKCFQHVANQLV